MKYPIGVQDFEKIRREDYAYVDKTEYIYHLINDGSYYFLSRPRRFGKSLLISTIEAYFLGKKELFEGLAIAELEKDWKVCPVLHLDLNTGKYDTKEALIERLNNSLDLWEKQYEIKKTDSAPWIRFENLIRLVYQKTGKRVAILVDEYDKPLLQAITNEPLKDEFRSTLKAFYSVVKTQDRYIRFALFTGVTKFSKVSVFSDLNNIEDISRDTAYGALCGITKEEIAHYFGEGIEALMKQYHITEEECYAELKRRYDGYRFEYDAVGVYNPFSLLNTFKNGKFGSYWFETGTPTFLVELLKKNGFLLERLQGASASGDELDSIDSFSTNPIPIIYQSGYLTIKDYDEEFRVYQLGYPNEEVSQGFAKYLFPIYANRTGQDTEFSIREFVNDVRSGNANQFMERLKAFFADVNYEVVGDQERYFQNVMHLLYKLMGFYVEVERRTNHGRMDAVIKTSDYIYIIETKLDGTAAEALQQIDDKGYAEPFALDSRKLIKIGVNFKKDTRGIADYQIGE